MLLYKKRHLNSLLSVIIDSKGREISIQVFTVKLMQSSI